MSECEICEFAADRGAWPLLDKQDLTIANPGGKMKTGTEMGYSITHCGDSHRAGVTGCHRSWTSLAQAHCVVCHEQFATNDTADRHWIGSDKAGSIGRHTPPSEVSILVAVEEQFGPVWRRAE